MTLGIRKHLSTTVRVLATVVFEIIYSVTIGLPNIDQGFRNEIAFDVANRTTDNSRLARGSIGSNRFPVLKTMSLLIVEWTQNRRLGRARDGRV
jgi:hypothetical protein